jgi:hypothetical protein
VKERWVIKSANPRSIWSDVSSPPRRKEHINEKEEKHV